MYGLIFLIAGGLGIAGSVAARKNRTLGGTLLCVATACGLLSLILAISGSPAAAIFTFVPSVLLILAMIFAFAAPHGVLYQPAYPPQYSPQGQASYFGPSPFSHVADNLIESARRNDRERARYEIVETDALSLRFFGKGGMYCRRNAHDELAALTGNILATRLGDGPTQFQCGGDPCTLCISQHRVCLFERRATRY